MAINREKVQAAAERYAARGQYDKAAREYQSMVEADPRDVRTWLLLADCLVRSGQVQQGVERYLHVAQHYEQQKDLQKALAVYRQVLNIDAGRVDVQLRCAEILDDQGMRADAAALYERAGITYAKAGMGAEAIAIFARLAEQEPNDVARRLRLAELHSREGQTAAAIEQFKRVCDQLWAAGAFQDYTRVAERLLYHDANIRDVQRDLASAYVRIGQARKAVAKLGSLLQATPEDVGCNEIFAYAMAQMGKEDKAASIAIEIARRVRKDNPDIGKVIALLEMVATWDSAQDAEAKRLLGELRGRAGKPPSGPSPGARPAATASSGPARAATASPTASVDDSVPDVDEVDFDDDMIEEVTDDDALEIDDETDFGGVGAEVELARDPNDAPASLADAVVAEARRGPEFGNAIEDVDKMLHEALVLVKYRLFEHALSHAEAAVALEPNHVRALGLKARIVSELSRHDEAARLHLQIVEIVHVSDPALAGTHLEALRKLDISPQLRQAAQNWEYALQSSDAPAVAEVATQTRASTTAPAAISGQDASGFDDDAFSILDDDLESGPAPDSSVVSASAVGLTLESEPEEIDEDDFSSLSDPKTDALERRSKAPEEDEFVLEDDIPLTTPMDAAADRAAGGSGDGGAAPAIDDDDDLARLNDFAGAHEPPEFERADGLGRGEASPDPILLADDDDAPMPIEGTQAPAGDAQAESGTVIPVATLDSEPIEFDLSDDEVPTETAEGAVPEGAASGSDLIIDDGVDAPIAVAEDEDDDSFSISVQTDSVAVPIPTVPADVEDRFGLDDDEMETTPIQLPPMEPIASAPLSESAAAAESGPELATQSHSDEFASPDEVSQNDVEIEAPPASPELDQSGDVEPPADIEPSIAAAATDDTDLSGELGEVEFFLSQGLDDDAREAVEGLLQEHPNHAGVKEWAVKLGLLAPTSTPVASAEAAPSGTQSAASLAARPSIAASAQASDEAEGHTDSPTAAGDAVASALQEALDAEALDVSGESGDSAARPLLSFDDDEDDDYLADIFSGSKPEEKASKGAAAPTGDAPRARAEVSGADAGTHFDLGTAYHGMGLADDALREFASAAQDPVWKARSLVMTAQIRVGLGQIDQAVADLREAVQSAQTKDESNHAAYELAVILTNEGNEEDAANLLTDLPAGYRDRDARLEVLRGF